MKKFLMVFAVCAFVSPLFSACAEKCAEDDCKCITQCVDDYAAEKCGKRADIAPSELFDYLACISKLDGDDAGDSCIENYNKNKTYCDDLDDWDDDDD